MQRTLFILFALFVFISTGCASAPPPPYSNDFAAAVLEIDKGFEGCDPLGVSGKTHYKLGVLHEAATQRQTDAASYRAPGAYVGQFAGMQDRIATYCKLPMRVCVDARDSQFCGPPGDPTLMSIIQGSHGYIYGEHYLSGEASLMLWTPVRERKHHCSYKRLGRDYFSAKARKESCDSAEKRLLKSQDEGDKNLEYLRRRVRQFEMLRSKPSR